MLNLNTPSCLENYIISLNGCYAEGVEPTSGYYLENLEGLTLNNVAAVSNEALVSATKTIEEKMYFAADIVEKRLKAVLNARGIKLNNLGKTYCVCKLSEISEPGDGYGKGIKLSKAWLGSTQSRIWVESVSFKSKIGGNTTLVVSDINGNPIYIKNIYVNADEITNVFIKKHFNSDVIYITIDTTYRRLGSNKLHQIFWYFCC